MSDLDKILDEDVEWRKKFNAMPIDGNCDSLCGKPANTWFGNTSRATCGDQTCINHLQSEYNEIGRRVAEDDD